VLKGDSNLVCKYIAFLNSSEEVLESGKVYFLACKFGFLSG